MKLYDYMKLVEDDIEITVFDTEYDIETYFYSDFSPVKDSWENSMERLSKLLTIKKILSAGVMVNLSKIIENKLEKLKKASLFYECETDFIMNGIESILSGNVSEYWMEKFIEVLEEK